MSKLTGDTTVSGHLADSLLPTYGIHCLGCRFETLLSKNPFSLPKYLIHRSATAAQDFSETTSGNLKSHRAH